MTTSPPPTNPTKPPDPCNNKKNGGASEKFEYEFGGPIGAFLTTILLPLLTLALTEAASAGDLSSLLDVNSYLPYDLFDWERGGDSRVLRCMIATLAWFLFQVFLQRVLPCELVQGAVLPKRTGGGSELKRDGASTSGPNRLTYRINGHLGFWVTLLIVGYGWPYWTPIDDDGGTKIIQFGRAPLHLLYDYYTELAIASIIWCTILSIYLFLRTHLHPPGSLLLAKGGQSGNWIYDFYIGRELNPTWGTTTTTTTNRKNAACADPNPPFEWKEFCELRPGLILWVVLNLSFLSVQHQRLGYVSSSMLLVNAFQLFYVWDALYQEPAILTTMDITTDGFGFMLVFGDMAWVPFTYSLQARYLVDHDPGLGWVAVLAILVVHMAGYAIFRGANSEKDAFRRDPTHPSVSHLRYHPTERGTRLLISGWWGLARKINYTGDWIMGLSWCLVCGFGSVVPYFYAVYFAILLLHRSERDDHMCREKYGADWDKYRELVPYRFIPWVV